MEKADPSISRSQQEITHELDHLVAKALGNDLSKPCRAVLCRAAPAAPHRACHAVPRHDQLRFYFAEPRFDGFFVIFKYSFDPK